MPAVKERTAGDLRNYAKFVRLSLRALVDGEPLPVAGHNPYPQLTRGPDGVQWHPSAVPNLWQDESDLDPMDPQFRAEGWDRPSQVPD